MGKRPGIFCRRKADEGGSLEKQWEIPADASEDMIADYARQAASEFTYGTNMRKRRVQAASGRGPDPP